MFVFAQLGRYTDSLEFSSKTYQGLGLYDEGVIPSSNCIGTECKCQGPTGVCECSSIHPLSPLFTHWCLSVLPFTHCLPFSPTVFPFHPLVSECSSVHPLSPLFTHCLPFSPTGVCECSSIHPLSPLFTHCLPFSPTGVCECSSIHPLSPFFLHVSASFLCICDKTTRRFCVCSQIWPSL